MRKLFLAALFISASMSAAVLPVYNADGYTTKFVISNPTSEAIALTGDGLIYGCVCPPKTVPAHGYVYTSPKTSGIGVESLDVPDGLNAYAEITTPHGVPVYVGPLTARETNYVSRVRPITEGENGGLFIAAETDAVAQVEGGGAFRLKAGQGVIANAPNDLAVVFNTWGGVGAPGLGTGKLYVFGFRNQWSTGALVVIPSE